MDGSNMIFKVESSGNISWVCSTKCNPIATDDGFIVISKSTCIVHWTDNQRVCLILFRICCYYPLQIKFESRFSFLLQITMKTEHKSPISSMCLSQAARPYICSCSDDKVIIWRLDDFRNEFSEGLKVGV